MGGTHGRLFRIGDSAVHRLAPEAKTVALIAFTLVLVATPREWFPAFGGYAVLLVVVAAIARVPAGWLAVRMLIEVPFVVLAVVLPIVGPPERVTWLGLSLSVDGLYGGWNILVKGTLGTLASLLLAATTTPRDLLVGLRRLRVPAVVVQIASFMLRYVVVLTEQAQRMRTARLARCHDPRFLWQAAAFARGLGTLFLRSFERGERVYLAMLSRGYTGAMPVLDGAGGLGAAARADAAGWMWAMTLPLAALVTAGVVGWTT